ncbi:MAG: lipid asymmetry maintenance protein MlaB [Solirubrobacterales bacterium]
MPAVPVTLSARATILEVEDIVARLRAGFELGGDLVVDCSAVEDVDFAFLQVLLAARREAERRGVGVSVRDSAAGVIAAGWRAVGLADGDAECPAWINNGLPA